MKILVWHSGIGIYDSSSCCCLYWLWIIYWLQRLTQTYHDSLFGWFSNIIRATDLAECGYSTMTIPCFQWNDHVSGDYFNGFEVRRYEHGHITVHVAYKCNLQLSFNKRHSNTTLFPQQFTIGFTVILKLISSYPRYKRQEMSVIPTTEDKEVMIKVIDSSTGLTDVWQIYGQSI